MDDEFIDANEKGAEGENFVNEIAFKSFIKYWCYPGPLDITGDYKEICDLLVVFNTICIIVSVKNYHFKEDYDKYFKKTVDKAIRQINGAERKLFGERPVLLKHPDRKEIVFDKGRIKSIYRIVVNLNTSVKYYQTSYFDNDKHYTVMDAEAWFGALLELDSLPDFVNYITARCLYFSDCSTFVFPREEYDFNEAARISSAKQIFDLASRKSRIGIILGSELDLIAYYITKGWSFPNDSQLNEEYGMFFFDIDGAYVKYKESKAVERKEEQERESYFIDNLVRDAVLDHEHGFYLAEMLLNLDRLDRASFARKFLELHDKYRNSSQKAIIHSDSLIINNLPMIFLYYKEGVPREEIDVFLNLRMRHFHYITNSEFREVGVLGMSELEQRFVFGFSKMLEDFSREEINDMEETFASLGWKLRTD